MKQCTEVTLKEIHEHTLEIVKKIIEICDSEGIVYYVAYGSLLGAVRHHGFIPWDDDFDIIMLRPEYNKFAAYCSQKEQELKPFKLMNHQNTKGFPFGIARFCDTRYRMERLEAGSAGMGLFVDIYPYDGIGDHTLNRRIRHIVKSYYTRMTNYANLNQYSASGKKYVNIIRKPLYRIAKKNGADYYLDKLEKRAYKYPIEHCKYIGTAVWGTDYEYFDKDWFAEWINLDFEGIQVKAPKHYDEILKMSYGDYMKLPPEEERQQTHGYRLYLNDEESK